MRRLPLFLVLILVALQWPLWNGYWELFQTKKSIDEQQKVNQELIYRNAALQADIRDLKQGNDAVQERARLQLGMVKSDEVFVQVMDQPSAVAAGPSQTAVSPALAAGDSAVTVRQAAPVKPIAPLTSTPPVKDEAVAVSPPVASTSALKP
ncbi:septum formation initiator family protein [Ephemeroptericola cinctiostellae]|nr:septum formation initiator family protein [Ephemeroptericola cinctiostellae]